MTQRVVQHMDALKKLKRLKGGKKRDDLLKHGGKPLQLCLRECALNILKGNVPLTSQQLKKLKAHKVLLREFCKNRTSQRRRFEIEQKGGFLPALLAPVIGAVLGVILKKKKK